VRSDSSKVDPNKPHEFRGGNRVYFEGLKEYKWKETLRTKRNGEIRLFLTKPARLSAIVLNKATVGRLDFSGGEIVLSVQTTDNKWHDLFIREDDDVDIRVRITRPRDVLRNVKSVRVRFKTPEPITIGPIDLLP